MSAVEGRFHEVAKSGGIFGSAGSGMGRVAANWVEDISVHDDFSLEEDGDQEGVMVYEESAQSGIVNTAIVAEMKSELGDIFSQCAAFRC